MIDPKLINIDFFQTGNICVISSYGIIIEYFSKGAMSVNNVISKFVKFFSGLQKEINRKMILNGNNNKQKLAEDTIYGAFIAYCQNNGDKRGYDLIKELHENDTLNSNCFCQIIGNKAQLNAIDKHEVAQLRENLKSGGLAMVLYSTNPGSHSIVVGYDQEKKSYFKRDPNNTEIENVDFLQSNDISEYLHFEEKGK